MKKLSFQEFGLDQLQALVLSGETRKSNWRRKQLNILSNLLENHQKEILDALIEDLKNRLQKHTSRLFL